jgi:Fe(3+) dicitrate transport protein
VARRGAGAPAGQRRDADGARESAGTDANAGLREDNVRRNTAWSGFAQQRLATGRFTVTPGVRVEHIAVRAHEPLNDAHGTTELTQVIPGAGMTYEAVRDCCCSPARTAASRRRARRTSSTTAAAPSVDLDAELSWNYEAGFRGHAGALNVELTAFRMDFENQIIPRAWRAAPARR